MALGSRGTYSEKLRIGRGANRARSESLTQRFRMSLPLHALLLTTLTISCSWSAVVRGAVLYGIGSIVYTRKLKQHYGVIIATDFIPGIHDEADSYIDPWDGTKLTGNNVQWLAAKVTPKPYSNHTPMYTFH